ERRAGRRTHGRGDVMVSEGDAVLGNRLQSRQRIIRTGKKPVSPLVGDDEDDVGFLVRRLAGRDGADERRQDRQHGQTVISYLAFHFTSLPFCFLFWFVVIVSLHSPVASSKSLPVAQAASTAPRSSTRSFILFDDLVLEPVVLSLRDNPVLVGLIQV